MDGWDPNGTVVCAGGLRAPDPELHELVNPYTVLQYEYWPDSAGAGEWRGGLGTIYRWRVDTDNVAIANFGGGNRPETAPFGLEGGKAAPPHQLYLRQKPAPEPVHTDTYNNKPTPHNFEFYQRGAGGYGHPRRRPAEKVLDDVVNGLVSVEKAKQEYGVVIDPKGPKIDRKATEELRAGGARR